MENKFEVKYLTDADLLSKFGKLVQTERKIINLVVEYIAEIDARKLYLERAYSSLYEFLTSGHGYSGSAAMRRIESARLLHAIPEISFKLESGALNLSHLAAAAKGFRQIEEVEGQKLTSSRKKELLSKLEYSTHRQTELIIAQEFNLPIPAEEKQKIHQDESMTLTIHFTKEEMETLNQVKDLISHSVPESGWNKVMMYLAKKELDHRTKVKQTASRNKAHSSAKDSNAGEFKPVSFPVPLTILPTITRKSIPANTRKAILAQDKCCQYEDPLTNKICGSTRFLQDDHRQPVWAGGNNRPENLQILCAQHNRLKYRKENGLRTISN